MIHLTNLKHSSSTCMCRFGKAVCAANGHGRVEKSESPFESLCPLMLDASRDHNLDNPAYELLEASGAQQLIARHTALLRGESK